MEGQADPGTQPQDASDEAFLRAANLELGHGYRLAGWLLGSAVEAEDALQDALAHAWRAWPSLRDRDRFPTWFQRIIVNACRDRMRRRGRVVLIALDEQLMPPARDPFAVALDRDVLGRALRRLPFEQREVVVLRYWADLPVDEIGARLGIPSGTVKSRLHHGLRALRVALEPDALMEVAP